ncbi:calcium sensing receptor [Carex littledalei]|uniref:Calcium sensing receptor n=1 Tax=Carex littledalei TaxID=544730 RepID=A0A833R3N3_9POAL|nr:calcium sensing receptor [Carex littledalei]
MALFIRAVAVTKPSLPPRPTTRPTNSPRPQIKSIGDRTSPLLSPVPTSLSLLALFSSPGSLCEAQAVAISKEDLVEETIDQVGGAGSKAVDFASNVFKVLSEVLKPGVDAAVPVLQSAGQEALKIASPVVSDASKQAKEALQSAGVDPSPVFSAAKTVADAAQQTTKVIEGAKPIASATVETITSSDPSVVVVSAGALFLAYLLLPPLWSLFSFTFRGYKGNLTPAQALEGISSQNYLLIDIRSEKDKDKAGVPQLPAASKNKMIAIPLEELPSKLKGLVRSTKQVEAEIVALKISYLKRVNKGSNIVIMDSYSDIAKIVAKTLNSLGFSNCWVMTDGFSGRKGWLQSRLGIDSYNLSLVEILSPSRVIPARFGTTSSASDSSQRKLLPGR